MSETLDIEPLASPPLSYGKCACGCGEDTLIATRTRTNRGWVKGQPKKYVYGHTRRAAGLFWSRVEKQEDGCWVWTGHSRDGRYGSITIEGGRKRRGVHRWHWEQLNGSVPEGLQLDHLCRNTLCVNPDHLEAVTPSENVRRSYERRGLKTHCPQGHEYDEQNTRYDHYGYRHCRTCARERKRVRPHE